MRRRPTGRFLLACAPGSLVGLGRTLTDRGWSVQRVEVVRRVPVAWPRLPRWLDRHPPADVWIVTSRAVLDTFVRGRPRRLRALRTIPRVLAVGPATATALRAVGIRAEAGTPALGVSGLRRRFGPLLGQRVLYLRSDRAGSALARWLRERGARVIDRVVYRTRMARRLPHGARRRAASAAYWVVSSPSALAGLRRAIGGPQFRRDRSRVRAFALGRRTARALRAAGVRRVLVGPESSEEGVTRLLAQTLADAVPPGGDTAA